MRTRSQVPQVLQGLLVLPALLGSLAGCDLSGDDFLALSECDPGTAAIGISDGLIARLCGCNEGGGGWQAFGSNLECTVANGTTVVFHYLSLRLRHQVISTQASVGQFAPSPVSDPADDPMIRAHALQLQSGTYDFTDTFDSGLSARITVL